MSPDLGVVENVRVSVAFAHAADGPPDEVFMLELHRGAPPTQEWDEHRYIEPLDDVLPKNAARPYSIAVTRWHSTWGEPRGHAEISLRVGLGTARETADAGSVHAVLAAFRDMLADGTAAPRVPVSRLEAITVARRMVTAAWGDVVAGDLDLTEEEHRPAERLWTIGLVGPEGIQYRVEVGLVDGLADTVHARRTAPAEIVDSVGTT